MDVKLGERYLYRCDVGWSNDTKERDMAHHNRPCRALRHTMPKDFFPPAVELDVHILRNLWWVVFDDGYITVANLRVELQELPPLPME